MRRNLWLAAVMLMVSTLVMNPVSALDDPCYDATTGEPLFQSQQTYIHQGQTKAGNAGATGHSDFPSWDTTKPSQSVQQGAGGGYLGAFALGYANQDDAPLGATFIGNFAGCLDTMLVELYAFLPTNRTGTSGSLEESPLNVWTSLRIDNVNVITMAEIETKTIANPGGQATYRIRYAFSGLHSAMVSNGLDPLAEHTIRLNAIPRFVNTSNALFVYDTTEVPAGILFNGTVDETYTLIEAF